VASLVASSLAASAQTAPSAPTAAPRAFQEQDAANLMDRLHQALQSESRSRTLKLFDATRMPGFPVFRDEIAQFFAQYQPPGVDYHIQQVSQDGALGAIIAEFVIEAIPWTDGQPALHRRAQVRLITSWDGKEWKIADLSPRDLFQ
jgi:hypothetical protein